MTPGAVVSDWWLLRSTTGTAAVVGLPLRLLQLPGRRLAPSASLSSKGSDVDAEPTVGDTQVARRRMADTAWPQLRYAVTRRRRYPERSDGGVRWG
jgi:hypothetical protein